ncbi:MULTISPECIES: DsbA family protein [unclassified Rathayibacter]|uniref:DsbA family protein n=1 Tax=unclassified Rathayibacter TaxID=2609250 RepID=UPI00188CE216|nr:MULTISPECIES: thioredoxin domain-containing protein [unclassified Rathayibacter]MBF4463480.1 thioredoxin domain-containing protein [Rathayibacter sp. VKM Ac-2879]MBF4504798.1 thioredoxin domain-containing protein [Rathayibacter sp. VKM Ac-2878]
MSGTSKSTMTKRERRELARAQAREQREQARRRRRRNRILAQSGAAVGLLAVVALVAWNVWSQQEVGSIGPANMLSDGIVFTGSDSAITALTTPALQPDAQPIATDESAPRANGVATIDLYVDYLCPYCGQFEKTNGDQLQSWLKQGMITLEIHPIAILDASSAGSDYSSRAANAAACVAADDPNHFLAVNTALFAKQPAEGTTGLDDDSLRSLVTDAGVTDDQVLACITSGEFRPWVAAATQRATTQPLANSSLAKLKSTPTVLVDGQEYTGKPDDASAFESFITSTVAATPPGDAPAPPPTTTPGG